MGSCLLEEITQGAPSGVIQIMNKTFERIDSACNTGYLNDSCVKITMRSVLKALCAETEPFNIKTITRIMRINGYEYSTFDMTLAMDKLVNMGMVSEVVTRELQYHGVEPRIVVDKLYIIEPLTAMHVHTFEKGL